MTVDALISVIGYPRMQARGSCHTDITKSCLMYCMLC